MNECVSFFETRKQEQIKRDLRPPPPSLSLSVRASVRAWRCGWALTHEGVGGRARMYVCVCVCERERERERGGGGEGEREGRHGEGGGGEWQGGGECIGLLGRRSTALR